MGFSIDNENGWGDMDEEPVHDVNLSAYWIDKYEVTGIPQLNFFDANGNLLGRRTILASIFPFIMKVQ